MNSKKISRFSHSCPRHNFKEAPTRNPTIQCHEEVMSKLSSCCPSDNVGGPLSCGEPLCHHRKSKNKLRKTRNGNIKTVSSIPRTVHHSSSEPVATINKDRICKPTNSKSSPIAQKPNLEDSVDFIPVKLSSSHDQKCLREVNTTHNIGKASKHLGPTWDEILRKNLKVTSYSDKPLKRKYSISGKTNKNSHKSLPSTPERKDSATNTNQESDDQPEEDDPQTNKVTLFNHLSSSDPIETLDFLIKQLREGLLKQPESNSLQKIILDMENALFKISVENKTNANCPPEKKAFEVDCPSELATRSSLTSRNHEKIKSSRIDVAELESNLEKSCRFLQSLCIKQNENCNNHLREKEQLSLQLAESRRLLAVSKSNEKNYEVTIGELRLKLQEANTQIGQLNQSLEEVRNENLRLKEENQVMASVKDSLKKVSVRLRQIANEKEKLQSKLSLKDLEIEKLKVLLEVRNNQIKKSKQEKPELSEEHELDAKISDDEKDISLISVSTFTSWPQDKPGIIMCSSQASSSPRYSPSPYNSWQHISSIIQQPSEIVDINKGMADIFQSVKTKLEQKQLLQLDLQSPTSSSSLFSIRDGRNSKFVYSDGENESLSS